MQYIILIMTHCHLMVIYTDLLSSGDIRSGVGSMEGGGGGLKRYVFHSNLFYPFKKIYRRAG